MSKNYQSLKYLLYFSVVFATELGRWRALLLNLSRVALPSLHFGRKVLACHERRPGPSCSKLTMPLVNVLLKL